MKKKLRQNPNRKAEILTIRIVGDKTLHQKAKEVTDFGDEFQDYIDDLIATLYKRDGVGLAAPQTGKSIRVFVIDPTYHETKKKNPLVFVNPVILNTEGSITFEEGCLSVPDIYEKVKRAEFIKIKALDRFGKAFAVETEDYPAVVIQHEYDHLDGILFTDRISKLKLIPLKKRIRLLKELTDENGNNIRVYNEE